MQFKNNLKNIIDVSLGGRLDLGIDLSMYKRNTMNL